MSRRLFAVALLPPPECAAQVDALRASLGDPRLADLPSHLTLVPPVALDHEAVELVRPALRAAASSSGPFELVLGPAASFAPRTSTLHLSVHGELERLHALRELLRRDPWDRPDEHAFVPHVTLLQRAAPERVRPAVELLSGTLTGWPVASVHLLERLRPDDRAPIWHPVAEEPLGGPRVVGRGGVELHLRTTSTVEPAVADLMGAGRTEPLPAGGDVLVAVAEGTTSPGEPVGAAVGRAGPAGAVLDRLIVAPAHRRIGVARHVVTAWCDAAAQRGAGVVSARALDAPSDRPAGPDPEGAAASLGFTRVDAITWCRRLGPLGQLGSP